MPWTMEVCLWWPYAAALGSTSLSMTPPIVRDALVGGRECNDEADGPKEGLPPGSMPWNFSMDDSREWVTDLEAVCSKAAGLRVCSHSSSSSSSRDTDLGENFNGSWAWWSGNVWDGAIEGSTIAYQ
jgi:hypothetical protein